MKIASVVILYNPVDEVIKNILSYIDYVEKVYVIDNTEKTNIEIENSISSFPKAIFISDGENKGIANRLNQACKLAVKDGFDWLLTMDQDSSFSIKDISTYKNCVQQLANTDQIAVTGVEIVRNENEGINCGFTEVTSLITSGSMINLALLNAIGVFDEALFIDQVDFEYCYRALLKGYKVIQFNNVF
ncbi:MAG: glycosyltransferase [Segetibacter sp.]